MRVTWASAVRRPAATLVAYAALLGAAALASAIGVDAIARHVLAPNGAVAHSPAVTAALPRTLPGQPLSRPVTAGAVRSSSAVLSSDDWLDSLKSESFWKLRRLEQEKGSAGSRWGNLGSDPMLDRAPGAGRGFSGTYRTVCVRLCDGYFFPVGYGVTPDRFEADKDTCERSCGSPAKLFVYRVPNETPEDMVDLKGQPYLRLKTAFLYRTTYSAACTCKPHPWQQEAQDMHRRYALQEAVRKGNRRAAVELRALAASSPVRTASATAPAGRTRVDAPFVAAATAAAPALAGAEGAEPPVTAPPAAAQGPRGGSRSGRQAAAPPLEPPMGLGAAPASTARTRRQQEAPPPRPAARSEPGWQQKALFGHQGG